MTKEKALEIQKTFGLNVLGLSLGILEQVRELFCDGDDIEAIQEEWEDCGNDHVSHEFLGTEGHMSGADAAILKESVQEFIDENLPNCNTWGDVIKLCSEEN